MQQLLSRFASQTWLCTLAAFGLFLLLSDRSEVQARTADEEALKRAKAQLEESGIEPTPTGLARYLEALHPDAESMGRLKKLIADLGDEDFYRREAAMKELLRLPNRSPELFQEAIRAGDAEIRWRAREVLKQNSSRSAQLLFATFQTIRHENLSELVPLIIKSLPYCSEASLREEAERTLKAIARPGDVPVLEEALKKNDPATQQVALVTLEHLIGPDADAELEPFLNSENAALQLTAARALANHGRRDVLPNLVDLLGAEELEVRAKAAATLRRLTGQSFSFVAYDTPARRAAARNRWVNWVANNAETAQLNFPIPEDDVLRGHTLLTNYSAKKVIELDAERKEVWSVELQGAWSCQGLSNGHRLVSAYTQRAIIEYDRQGKEVWSKRNLPGQPFSVQRLDNGNTLVACSNNQLLEYGPDGSVVWNITLGGGPRDAQRLENGNTLVALYAGNEIVEVDREGKEVWKQGQVNRPMSVQRLPNGNTLICQAMGQRLVELDRQGNVVWSPALTMAVYDVQRLPNGNTLFVGSSGAQEIDPQGKTIWQLNQAGLRGIHRF